MSDVVRLKFYYGPGTVQTTDMGADLSEFTHIEVPMSAPQTWSVSQLKEWITGSLGLDTETHTVGVHALWTRSSSIIYFYLRPIERDSEWVRWLQGCERRGCNPIALVLPVVKEVTAHEGEGGYDPGQSSGGRQLSMSNAGDDGYEPGQSSQVEGGNADGDYSGEVDADEVDGHMQDQMEEEDTDVDMGHADDSEEHCVVGSNSTAPHRRQQESYKADSPGEASSVLISAAVVPISSSSRQSTAAREQMDENLGGNHAAAAAASLHWSERRLPQGAVASRAGIGGCRRAAQQCSMPITTVCQSLQYANHYSPANHYSMPINTVSPYFLALYFPAVSPSRLSLCSQPIKHPWQ